MRAIDENPCHAPRSMPVILTTVGLWRCDMNNAVPAAAAAAVAAHSQGEPRAERMRDPMSVEFMNWVMASLAMAKVNTVTTSTVRLSARRSATIEPNTAGNGACWRWAM